MTISDKINSFQNNLNIDKVMKWYGILFFALLFMNLYYVYKFYPSTFSSIGYKKEIIFYQVPIYIGFFYLLIFQVIENKRWWIVYPICIYYLCILINNAASWKSPFVSSEFGFSFQFLTFMAFMKPVIMSIVTAYVGICVWWKNNE